MIHINITQYLKSKLDFNCFIILQIIYEHNKDLFNKLRSFYFFRENIKYLRDNNYVKYGGFNDIDYDNLELIDLVLLPLGTELFKDVENTEKVLKTKDWITEYRLKFKGIRQGSMGDPNACLKKMQLFIKKNPQYSKKDILVATDKYIENTDPKYTMQADYFISKMDINKIAVSKLLVILEEISLGNFKETNVSSNTMI